MNYTNEDFERDSLAYLKEVHTKLSDMIAKLNNRPNPSQPQVYITYQANHIRKITAGYISMRSQGMTYVASSLVRTCLESMFLMDAVRKDPLNLFHIACFENQRDLKLIRSASERTGTYSVQEALVEWEKTKSVFEKTFKDVHLVEKDMNLFRFAEEGDHAPEYNLLYRIYSNVVHASWRATIGSFASTHQFDNTSMLLCVARACFAVTGHYGEPEEDFSPMIERIHKLNAIASSL